MAELVGFGLGLSRPPAAMAPGRPEYVVVQHPLRRVLAFTGHTIDDIINDPVARTVVYGYYKLSRTIQRRGETIDLERQWDPLGIWPG